MIVINVETTEIYSKKHSILSIGAIDLENPNKQFYVENRISSGAEILYGNDLIPGLISTLKINGFTVEQINDKNKPSLKQTIKLFLGWIENYDKKVLAEYNLYFDLNFSRTFEAEAFSRLIYGRNLLEDFKQY